MGLQPQAGAKHVQGSHGKIGEGPGLQQLRDEDDDIRVQPASGPGGGEQEQLSVLGQTLGQVQHGPPPTATMRSTPGGTRASADPPAAQCS